MNIFWSFWIPANVLFWLGCAATVKKTTATHFVVGFVLSMISGVFPLLIYKLL